MKVKEEEKETRHFRKFFREFWYLIWEDEGIKGWIFSVIFLFIIIKFIFFPVLELTTGTELPLAIVESCSMYHSAGSFTLFSSWFERKNEKYSELKINSSEFKNFPLHNGFNKGDVLFIIKANPEKLKIGDIIIFNAGQQNPVIHRIISITEKNGKKYFSTIGDNNDGQHLFEKEISETQLVGKAALKITPYIGWIKLIFFEAGRTSQERGFCTER